jgi:glycerophosphoryl diester phosphodiesterase
MARTSLFSNPPIVIAHRGASGTLPEQTIEAFDLAIAEGADAIELDVIPTKDGTLLARHENELSLTTNVADHPAFASRKTTKRIDGEPFTGWFAEDFTAEEIRTLGALQRFPFRDHSHDDKFAVPTLEDVLQWRDRRSKGARRPIGIFIEIKHPTFFERRGFDISAMLLQTLAWRRLTSRECGIILMSSETRILRELRRRTELPIVQLLDAPTMRPFDWADSGDHRTYADLISRQGLQEIAAYADGIGPWKRLIVPSLGADVDGGAADSLRLARPTSLIEDAHAEGLFVCAWTFRNEQRFLAADYQGDPKREYQQFRDLGIDGLITDFPGTAARLRRA